ncbi:DUF1206 domain-containing protein [Hyphomonas pacifica]|uniref:DUF1206 domain-containing protein n=1 Tax=Hyphomonas pacifica TaxID=1280941 RepID=UPI000DC0523C|nr:DUF1206 domain-containing protein [Hyphomonas pacifica]RAN33749.1 hypothetical protein HY11_03390 [Hyphomonas pacifica]
MKHTANTALEWLMRAGYGARGVVYLIVGGIALFAAINGGEAEGTSGALEFMIRQPFGVILLAITAAGLFSYTLWRLVDGVMDLEDEGDDAEGYANRLGQIMSGLTHAALGISALLILIKGSEDTGGGGSGAENWSATLMQHPIGRLVVIAAGITTLSVAIYLFYKSWAAAHRKDIIRTDMAEMLEPAVRFGLAAHGFVLLIVGGLILWAGISADADKAAGLGEALQILETQPFGRTLLALTGAGLCGFAVYCFVMARYRIVPKLAGDTLKTLASPID